MNVVSGLILGVAIFFGLVQHAGKPEQVAVRPQLTDSCTAFECAQKRTI